MEAKYGVFGLDDSINFGIFNGSEVYEVIQKNPKWIRAAIEDALIELDNEAYKFYQECLESVGETY